MTAGPHPLRVIDLGDGSERTLAVREVLDRPVTHFAELGRAGDA